MSDHGKHDDHDSDLLEDLGYETADVNYTAKGLSALSFGFIAFIIGSFVIAWLFWTAADRVKFFQSPRSEPTARRPLPPEAPLLQSNITAVEDMVDLRKEERAKMDEMKWADDHKSAVIPVEDAMEIVLARGLPTRANPHVPSDYDQVLPNDVTVSGVKSESLDGGEKTMQSTQEHMGGTE